ncbi:hypothetical protein LCGC14_2384370, partial [marine sediment metagenome]
LRDIISKPPKDGDADANTEAREEALKAAGIEGSEEEAVETQDAQLPEGQPASAAGAIKLAAWGLLQDEEDRPEQAQKALEVLRLTLDVPTYPAIFGWNDAPERTPEDIVQALQRSAVQAETDHG